MATTPPRRPPPGREMTLRQAIVRAEARPGFYVFIRGGVPVYAGESADVRRRLIGYYREARILGADTTRIMVRITYATGAAADRRRWLEGSLIERLNRLRAARGLGPMRNVRRVRRREFARPAGRPEAEW